MTTFPNSPRLLKGGIVLIDPESAAVQRVIALQYNPDTLSRMLQVQGGRQGRRMLGSAKDTGRILLQKEAVMLTAARNVLATLVLLAANPLLLLRPAIAGPPASWWTMRSNEEVSHGESRIETDHS